jgi:hypothetical protein
MKKIPEIILINPVDLKPYENNPRDNIAAIDPVAKSIEEFGFRSPIIIDKNYNIINGHTRLLAALKLSYEAVPCLIVDDLTDAQIKAFRIADNKVSQYSRWDDSLLMKELELLKELDYDLELTGFREFEVDSLYQENKEVDYSLLDEGDVDNKEKKLRNGMRKAILIDFELEHYQEAFDLVKFWRGKEAYVGYMILNFLKLEKDKLDE